VEGGGDIMSIEMSIEDATYPRVFAGILPGIFIFFREA
jgi:hypothetical protein